jgi:hypothetical protein
MDPITGMDTVKKMVEKPGGKKHSEDLGADGKLILYWIIGYRVERCGLDASRTEEGQAVGCCEHGNESSVSIKGGNVMITWETMSFPKRSLFHGFDYKAVTIKSNLRCLKYYEVTCPCR